MVFSDTTTKQGLIQDCEQLLFSDYGSISGNENLLYDFTARINRAYDKFATKVMSVDGRWQWDDTNYTDFPIGKTALVDGQEDYSLDIEFMDVEKVVILDVAGNKKLLRPIDINDPMGQVYITSIVNTGGIPEVYDKSGRSLFLYPIPNYDKPAGLIVYYRRKPSYFAYTDTTKAVGVPAVYHRYLSLEASLDYAISKQMGVKNDLALRVKEMEADIEEWYSRRSKDESKFIRPIRRNTR
jgi:hypothetical protein